MPKHSEGVRIGKLGDFDKEKYLAEAPGSFLARAGNLRSIGWDVDVGAWRYPIKTAVHHYENETQEELDRYVKMLPLSVPGFKVVDAALCAYPRRDNNPYHPHNEARGYIWFSWSREAERERYRELVEKYGVADERLDYRECSGKLEPEGGQLAIPGIVKPELRWDDRGFVCAAWTKYGLQQIDGGFSQRIMYPNRGGRDAIPFNRECVVGDEWWLVGSRGDSEEVMAIEIQASPLDAATKENLLDNLRECRRVNDHKKSRRRR